MSLVTVTQFIFQTASKRKVENEPEWSARRCYNSTLSQLPVQQAATTVSLQSVERCLQRHKVKNRPPLPATRTDLVLDAQYSTTYDGRPFVLVDDGQVDRILVFGTEKNLER